jgi:hypothetical protein
MLELVVEAVNDFTSDFELREKLVDFFDKYKSKNWVYPDVFVRNFNMNMDDVIRLMDGLVNENVLSLYHSYSCPKCSHVVGNVRSLDNLPELVFCDHCDTEFEPKNTSIVYRLN